MQERDTGPFTYISHSSDHCPAFPICVPYFTQMFIFYPENGNSFLRNISEDVNSHTVDVADVDRTYGTT